MLSEQDKCEIRKSYRNAIDPRQQVKILMDLYLASREEIEETLGFTHKETRRPIRRHTDAGRPNTYAKHPIEVKQRIVGLVLSGMTYEEAGAMYDVSKNTVPFPVSWTVKMKKKQKETQDILSYHSQAAGCSDKARAKASGGRQPIEECGRTGL